MAKTKTKTWPQLVLVRMWSNKYSLTADGKAKWHSYLGKLTVSYKAKLNLTV